MIHFASHSLGWERIESADPLCFGVFPIDEFHEEDTEQIQQDLEADAARFLAVPRTEIMGVVPMADAVYKNGVMAIYFRAVPEGESHEGEPTSRVAGEDPAGPQDQ